MREKMMKGKFLVILVAFIFILNMINPIKVFAASNYNLAITFHGDVPAGCSVKYSLDNGNTWSDAVSTNTTVNNVTADSIRLQFFIADGYKLSGGGIFVNGTQDNGFSANNISNNQYYDITVPDNTNPQVDIQNLEFSETGTELEVQYHATGNGEIQYSTDNITWTSVGSAQTIIIPSSSTALFVKSVPSDGYVTEEHTAIFVEGNSVAEGTQLETMVNLTSHLGKSILIQNVAFVEENSNPGPGNDPDPQNPTNKNSDINLTYVTNETYTYLDNGVRTTKNYESEGADIAINGYMLNPGDTSLAYFVEDGADKVTFTFSTLWHMRYWDSIVINGNEYKVSDYLDYDDQTDWLNHYEGQIVGFDIPNVPLADVYDITVKVGRQSGGHVANFLWTGDPKQADGPDYIGHAHLEMIGLQYTVGGVTYTYNESDFAKEFYKDYVEYESDESLGYDEGSLVIPAGSKVTMRITPEYGYQVVASNMGAIQTTDSGVCEFTFTVGYGAAYFTADVKYVGNDVKATSEKVAGGDVTLASGSLSTGTARLTVSDVELSNDKITNFKAAAGDYDISTYVDIDLDQVFYRGSADSVWSNRIHRLNDYATITLKLEDGITADDIVIVHNIDDGDEFEIIEIESYDPATNTITFKTKSFSNYAIATKTKATDTTTTPATVTTTPAATTTTTTTNNTSPKTGDDMMMFVVLLTMSVMGLGIMTKSGLKKRLK